MFLNENLPKQRSYHVSNTAPWPFYQRGRNYIEEDFCRNMRTSDPITKRVTSCPTRPVLPMVQRWRQAGAVRDLLRVTLKHVDLHGGLAEVPQAKRRVLAGAHHELLRRVRADVGQLLVVTCAEVTGSSGSRRSVRDPIGGR